MCVAVLCDLMLAVAHQLHACVEWVDVVVLPEHCIPEPVVLVTQLSYLISALWVQISVV